MTAIGVYRMLAGHKAASNVGQLACLKSWHSHEFSVF
jgi:hypothetical protein